MPTLYRLDTNILVHQVRRDAVGERIQELYSPLLAEPRPLISVVTAGELRSLGFQFGWGREKTEQAHYLLTYFQRLTIGYHGDRGTADGKYKRSRYQDSGDLFGAA